MTIAALKEGVGKEALERRAALKPRVSELSRRLAEIFLKQVPVPSGASVSAYVAIGDEADPAALLHALHAQGHAIVLPRVARRGKALEFNRCEPGANLV